MTFDNFLKECDEKIAIRISEKRKDAINKGLSAADDMFYRLQATKEIILEELFKGQHGEKNGKQRSSTSKSKRSSNSK